MEATNYDRGVVKNVVAIGKGAAGEKTGAERLRLLGFLVWFSVSETHVRREVLLEAMDDAGLEERFAPGPISARDAFRRATSRLEVSRVKVDARSFGRLFGTDSRRANILVREVRSGADSVVRQVVREVVDDVGVRLHHAAVAQLELAVGQAGGEVRAFPLVPETELLSEERRILERVGDDYSFQREHHDSDAVRRLISRALAEAFPVRLRKAGGVYFVPREHEGRLRALQRFMEELKERASGASDARGEGGFVEAVDLADKEEHRETIARSLEEQIEREASSLLNEMGALIKSGKKITRKRQKDFVARVNELKEAVADYQELLETEISSARSNLDLAMKEAVALMSRVNLKG